MNDPRWFHVEATSKNEQRFGKYMYARKSYDGEKVTIFNGRHYIQTFTVDYARANFKLGKVVKDQEHIKSEYSWYLYY